MGLFLMSGFISVGQLTSLIFLQGLLYSSFSSFSENIPVFLSGKNLINKIIFPIKSKKTNLKNFNLITIQNFKILFANTQNTQLTNIKIRKNHFYAIIGVNGSGKSTLIKSILGFNLDFHGQIYWQNQTTKTSIHKLNPQSLLDFAMFIQSKPSILNTSIINNITLFDQNSDKNKVVEALQIVSLDKKILNQSINDKVLSEGEKQRLIIARAIYANKNFLIIDEGLSNIDHATRIKILNYFRQCSNMTLINVSHNITKQEEMFYDKIFTILK